MRRFLKDCCYALAATLATQSIARLPRKVALSIGASFGTTVFNLASRHRALVYKQLAVSLELEDEREVEQLARRCFQNLGKNLIEFMQLPRMARIGSENSLPQESGVGTPSHSGNTASQESGVGTPSHNGNTVSQISRIVSFEGGEYIAQALAEGNGAIILTGHFGNWELLAASIVAEGYTLRPLARRLRSKRLNVLLNAYRERAGYTGIDRDGGIRGALRCLKQNALLGILADVDTKIDGVFVDFFGRPAYTPYSPVAIALKTGAPILPTFIIRQPDDSHRVIVEPPLALEQSGDKQHDFVVNTQKFTKVIESYVRLYPEQWVWMHERWKTQP